MPPAVNRPFTVVVSRPAIVLTQEISSYVYTLSSANNIKQTCPRFQYCLFYLVEYLSHLDLDIWHLKFRVVPSTLIRKFLC